MAGTFVRGKKCWHSLSPSLVSRCCHGWPLSQDKCKKSGTAEGGEADPLLFLVGGGEDGRGEKGRGAPQCLEEEH